MLDNGIDTAIALENQAEVAKKRKDALAYLEKMELLNGKAYKEVTVKKKYRDKILFSHNDGAGSAKYDQLPSSLRKELGEFDIEVEARELARLAELERVAKEKRIQEERLLAEAAGAVEMKREAEEKRQAEERRIAKNRAGGEAQRNLQIYTKYANKGDAEFQFKLGKLYSEGKGVKKDLEKAFEWYFKAANQGDAEAQCELGLCYRDGKGVEKDQRQGDEWLSKAFEWYSKAAQQGKTGAQYRLGWCYVSGSGVKKDKKKGIEWYLKAANQGSAEAQYKLGFLYNFGICVEKDIKKSLKWYSKAAAQGSIAAMLDLGMCYDHGVKVEKDLERAFEWYSKAANQGCLETDLACQSAHMRIGEFYHKGQGVEIDRGKAFEFLSKAAKYRVYGAQRMIDEHYANGAVGEEVMVLIPNTEPESIEIGKRFMSYRGDGIRLGMSLEDFKKKYPDARQANAGLVRDVLGHHWDADYRGKYSPKPYPRRLTFGEVEGIRSAMEWECYPVKIGENKRVCAHFYKGRMFKWVEYTSLYRDDLGAFLKNLEGDVQERLPLKGINKKVYGNYNDLKRLGEASWEINSFGFVSIRILEPLFGIHKDANKAACDVELVLQSGALSGPFYGEMSSAMEKLRGEIK